MVYAVMLCMWILRFIHSCFREGGAETPIIRLLLLTLILSSKLTQQVAHTLTFYEKTGALLSGIKHGRNARICELLKDHRLREVCEPCTYPALAAFIGYRVRLRAHLSRL